MRCRALSISITSLLVVLLWAPRGLANPPLNLLAAQQEAGLVPAWFEEEIDEKGWIGVHGLVFLGAIWLDNRVPGRETVTDPTWLRGGGIGASYAFSPLFALECEVVGATSGTAELLDIANNTIERQATLGRGQCGAVFMIDYKTFVPTARGGLGVEGISHKATTVVSDGRRIDGPDMDFELDATYYVSLGVDAKLGAHFTVGVFAHFTGYVVPLTGTGTTGTLEFGTHVAVKWPERE